MKKWIVAGALLLACTVAGASQPVYKPVYTYDPYVAMQFDLGQPIRSVRSAPVNLGGGEKGFVFAFSADGNIDPFEGSFYFPKHPLVLAVFNLKGKELWRKELTGVVPGVWFTPVLPLDMDGDGVDELYYVNNIGDKPFMYKNFKLERADMLTGKVTGQWPWPEPTHNQANSYKWRFFLIGGKAQGKPVLVEAVGTYRDMRLVGLDPDMKKRWEVYYPDDDNGPRGSHSNAILDLTHDGTLHFLYGERCISFDDGKELFALDGDVWYSHSDMVLPVYDRTTKTWDYFTTREKGDDGKLPRAVMFGPDGRHLWSVPDMWGHWHYGWVGNYGPQGERIAMAGRYPLGNNDTEDFFRYYDAKTGKEVPPVAFPADSYVVDFNGDGVHEAFFEGTLYDRRGKKILSVDNARMVVTKHVIDLPGEQLMLALPDGKVQIWADRKAKDVPAMKQSFADPLYYINLQQSAVGYNARFPFLNY